jgi:iron complex outermembrane recepter protein
MITQNINFAENEMMKPHLKTPNIWPFALFVILFSIASQAQEVAEISGVIKSSENDSPLSNAEILLQPVSIASISDEKGRFYFKNLHPGEYILTVQHLGFQPYKSRFKLSADEKKMIAIGLTPEFKQLQEVEIVEQVFLKSTFIKDVIRQDQIENLPQRDMGDFLRSEPNISGVRKGGGNIDPVLRGFKFSQLNVQTNTGHKIEGGCPNRMDPALSHIDISDVSRLEIFKGPYALRYGPAFGGTLNLVTEKAQPFDTFGIKAMAMKSWESNWNGTKEHVTILGGNRMFYFALSGNNQQFGNYKDGRGCEVKSAFRKFNYTLELGMTPAKNHEIRLNFKNSQGRDIHFPALPMDERTDDTQLYSFSYRYRNPQKRLKSIDAKIYLSQVYHEMDNKLRSFSDTVVAVSIVDALNRGGRIDFGFGTEKAGLQLGADFEDIRKSGQRIKSFILQPGLPVKTEDLWRNAAIQNLGLFAEYKRQQNIFLDWILSARLDFNSAFSDPLVLENMAGNEIFENNDVSSGFTNLSISAGLSYEITAELSLDFALGRGVRNPDMVERFIILLPVGYDNYDYLGNPALKPEKNHQADLTFKWVCDHSGSFRLNGFYAIIADYITGIKLPPSQIMPQTQSVLGVKEFRNIDEAFLYGFEFVWVSPERRKLGLHFSTAITAGHNPEAVKYFYENGQVTGTENVKNDPLPEIPPLEANLKLNYRFFNKRLNTQLLLKAVARQNRISAAYDEIKTPGFFIAGATANYKLNTYLRFAAGINNIFDVAYYEHLNRRIIGSSAPLYEPGRSFYLNVILNF